MSPIVGTGELLVILMICVGLLVVIGLLVFALLRSRPGASGIFGKLKKCPYCAETIRAEAVVCRYCGRDLPSQS